MTVALSRKKLEVSKYFNDVSNNQKNRHDKYLTYHSLLAPKDFTGVLECFQFAACSVHQSWQGNVKMFQAVKSMPFGFTVGQLRKAFEARGTGLYNRANIIHRLTHEYWNDPLSFQPNPSESWIDFRARIAEKRLGLGLAKAAFALELAYPATCEVVCLDRWILRLYGIKEGVNVFDYLQLEKHWLKAADRSGVSPTMARHMICDDKHNEPNTRYWSYVFETAEVKKQADEIFKSQSATCQPAHNSKQQKGGFVTASSSSKAKIALKAAGINKHSVLKKSGLTGSKWPSSSQTCVPS